MRSCSLIPRLQPIRLILQGELPSPSFAYVVGVMSYAVLEKVEEITLVIESGAPAFFASDDPDERPLMHRLASN